MRASRPNPSVITRQPGAAILAQFQERRVVEADSDRGTSRKGGATTHTHAVTAILGADAATDGCHRTIHNGDAIAAVVLDDIVDERGARIAAESQTIAGCCPG